MTIIDDIIDIALNVPMTESPGHPDAVLGLPIYLEGPPGIGKSARLKSHPKRRGLPTGAIFCPVQQPENFTGVLVPDGKGGASQICMLHQVRELTRIGKGVLILDETNWAGRAVQGALLGAVLDRQFGDIVLPRRVRIVSAGNAARDADGGHKMIPPLANRFAWFKVDPPTATEWNTWRRSRTTPQALEPIEDLEAQVLERWPDIFPRFDGLVMGFMEKRGGDLLHNLPPVGNEERHRAWASPRSWDVAIRAVTTCHALGKPALADDFVAACVGEDNAKEWVEYLSEADLPDPEKMLKKGWKPNGRLDIATAAYGAATSWALERPDEKERRDFVILAWKLLETACAHGVADIALACAEQLMDAGWCQTKMKAAGQKVDQAVVDASAPVIIRFSKSKLTQFSSKAPS
jgi:hypothetical protein